MDTGTVVALGSLFIEIISMVAGGVWAIGRLKTMTAVLSNTLDHVNTALVKMEACLDKLDEKIGRIEVESADRDARLRSLESQRRQHPR